MLWLYRHTIVPLWIGDQQITGPVIFFSRLPMPSSEREDINVVSFVEEIPLLTSEIAKATWKNPVFSKVYDYTLHWWPNYVNDAELKPYVTRRHEFSVDNGLILLGFQVVIPSVFRKRLLQELHVEYLGKCKMKALVRCYIWWNSIDSLLCWNQLKRRTLRGNKREWYNTMIEIDLFRDILWGGQSFGGNYVTRREKGE